VIFKIKKANFLPHQTLWWDLETFIKLLVGGYGCGKTYIGSLRSIYLTYLNSGIPGQYVSPTYKLAKRTVIPTVKEILNRSGISYNYNKTDNEFHIHNWDGHFWVGSGDDPDSLRGPNLAWAGIDEPFIQSQEVLSQMLARVRHPQADHREIFLTGTPEQLNWGYDVATNDEGKYDIGYVAGKTKDNTYLPPEYYETLFNAYSPEQREAYLNGKFLNLTLGRAYSVFDRERHIKILDGYRNLEICAGLDFNVDYMSAEIYANGNGWVHYFDEIRLKNSNSFELSERLAAKYPGIRVFPDATGAARKSSSSRSDHQIFRDAGFNVVARRSNPRVMDRVNAMNKILREDKMSIEPGTCPMLVKDLERVTWKSGDLDKTTDLSLTHASDAAGYPIAYNYPVVKREVYIQH